MSRWFLILWMLFCVPNLWADEVPVSTLSPEVQQVLDCWRLHAQETDWSSRAWKIVRQSPSENFGQADLPESASFVIQIMHDKDHWRLEGESIVPPGLSRLTLALIRKESSNGEEFQAALSDRFQQPMPFLERVPYLFIVNPGEERHLWWSKNEAKPVAVAICAPGTSAACFDRPLFSYLLEAEMSLAGSGMPLPADQSVKYSLLSETKPIAGAPCHVLQAWTNNEKNPQLMWELWLEAGDNVRLRRCRLFSPDQILVQYEEASGSFPQKLSLLRLNGSGDVVEQMVAIAQPVESELQSTGINWNSPLPEGMLVADFVQQERMIVAQDGNLRPLTPDDLPLSIIEVIGRRFEQLNLERPLTAMLIHWFSWPWVLIPIGGIYLAGGLLLKVVGKRHVDTRSHRPAGETAKLELHHHQH